jgi:hypothetical protein
MLFEAILKRACAASGSPSSPVGPNIPGINKRLVGCCHQNRQWLQQALRLLTVLTDDAYRRSPAGFYPHRVGGHLRHILEFYECFLDGLESHCIDYDARKRNVVIENSRAIATDTIRSVIQRLQDNEVLRADSILRVRMEDCDHEALDHGFLTSSAARELQVLSSHTIHHFALIGMTLTALGLPVDPGFGVAPSTLRYRARVEAA